MSIFSNDNTNEARSRRRNRRVIVVTLCLLGITAILLFWHRYGMNRALTISNTTRHSITARDDRGLGGTSVATVAKTASAIVLHCKLTHTYQWPYCGFGVVLSDTNQGLNVSQFDTIELNIHTEGAEPIPIKIYLLNFNPVYSVPGNSDSLKINEIQYYPNEKDGPRTLPVKNFHVSPWWLRAHNTPPEHAGRDLRNIVRLQIFTGDIKKMGAYAIVVDSIVLRGKWLSEVEILSIILGLWLLSAIAFLSSTFWGVRREIGAIHQQKKELEDLNNVLQLERQELEQIATHDELTGLHNRVGLRNRLLELAPRGQRDSDALSVIFMDIDHFKRINDACGHLIGDQILQRFATLIQGRVRDQDFLCRWGGEEFIMLCHNTALEPAYQLAEDLRDMVAQADWPDGMPMTCSFGVAQRQFGESVGDILERADNALYKAKSAGRNCVQCSLEPAPETSRSRTAVSES